MDERKKPASYRDENNLCAFCKNIAKTRCAGCLKVYYCNKEHQKLDWKIHSNNCSALKLVKYTTGQQYYVAKRNIKLGEIVYEEDEPIVIGPVTHFPPSCLSCYIPLKKETAIPCKKCGWPLCRDCKTHGPECEFATEILKQKISITDFERSNMIYGHAIVARSLALETANPSAYSKLLKLRVRTENGPNYYEGVRIVTQSLLPFIPKQSGHIGKEISQNIPALTYHRHMIRIKNGSVYAVYENVRYFKNDCASNCTKIISDIGGISIRAVTPISKGENVTICYTDPLFHAMQRRSSLRHNFINCQCKRCKDPTEFGTMYNTVKCIKKDCDGYMLPPTFIVDSLNRNLPDFVCDKCNARVSQITIMDVITQFEKELTMVEWNGCRDTSQYTKILEKQRKILHEGHGNIAKIKASIVSWISKMDKLEQISKELLIEYIKYCKEIVEFLKLLTPSETMVRGALLFQWLRMRCEYSDRYDHGKSLLQNLNFREDFLQIALECNDLLLIEKSPYCERDAQASINLKGLIDRIISENESFQTS